MPAVAPLEIIYDGECPFCSDYVRLLRLRENIGDVKLSDARRLGARGEELRRAGFDLDQGMMAIYGGRKYLGTEAATLLAMLADPRNKFLVRLVNWLVREPSRAKWGYPLLRSGRNMTLFLRGKQKINAH